ncbi:MAG: hypothetical protein PVF58_18530, partial [Candidatus Methanofastidiosia archaeon]
MDLKTKKLRKIRILILICFSLMVTGIIPISQVQPLPAGTATVYGRACYKITDTKIEPIRFARTELYDASTNIRLATCNTNKDGYYEFSINITGSIFVYARIYSDSHIANVVYGTYESLYSFNTPTMMTSEGSATYLGTYYTSEWDYQWRAMDYAIDEWEWLKEKVNWTRSKVKIKYPSGDWPWTDGNVIYLPDRNVKNWDRTTVLHEYAHCIMYALYNGFPAGGCTDPCQCGDHHRYNSVADSGFAFKEGWAEFMQSAVDNNPSNTYLHELGDVDGNGVINDIATNIEDNAYPIEDADGHTKFWCKWYHGRCPLERLNTEYYSFNHNGCLV